MDDGSAKTRPRLIPEVRIKKMVVKNVLKISVGAVNVHHDFRRVMIIP